MSLSVQNERALRLIFVMSRGQVYDRARLDRLMAGTKAWVAAQK
jgi:hypothetical protein